MVGISLFLMSMIGMVFSLIWIVFVRVVVLVGLSDFVILCEMYGWFSYLVVFGMKFCDEEVFGLFVIF